MADPVSGVSENRLAAQATRSPPPCLRIMTRSIIAIGLSFLLSLSVEGQVVLTPDQAEAREIFKELIEIISSYKGEAPHRQLTRSRGVFSRRGSLPLTFEYSAPPATRTPASSYVWKAPRRRSSRSSSSPISMCGSVEIRLVARPVQAHGERRLFLRPRHERHQGRRSDAC